MGMRNYTLEAMRTQGVSTASQKLDAHPDRPETKPVRGGAGVDLLTLSRKLKRYRPKPIRRSMCKNSH